MTIGILVLVSLAFAVVGSNRGWHVGNPRLLARFGVWIDNQPDPLPSPEVEAAKPPVADTAVSVSDHIASGFSPGSESPRVRRIDFETDNREARLISTGVKPTRLRFTNPFELEVREADLAATVELPDGGTLIVKEFTDTGFKVEERNTRGLRIVAEVYPSSEDGRSAAVLQAEARQAQARQAQVELVERKRTHEERLEGLIQEGMTLRERILDDQDAASFGLVGRAVRLAVNPVLVNPWLYKVKSFVRRECPLSYADQVVTRPIHGPDESLAAIDQNLRVLRAIRGELYGPK